MKTIIDAAGEEVSEADFDDYISPRYKYLLEMAPFCDDPDHPGCPKCEDTSEEEEDVDPDNPDGELPTEDFNNEPVPYTDNAPLDSPARGKEKLDEHTKQHPTRA
jgi:hypothetical protein